MTSVTASIEIDAPVASVWDALVDAGAYPDWHPFFRHGLDTSHHLRSGDRWTALLPSVDGLVPVIAMVLEVRRHRTITWLLLPEATAHAAPVSSGDPLDSVDVGLYRVEVREAGPGRTLMGQHLRLGFRLGSAQPDFHKLARRLDDAQEALRQREERAAAEVTAEHQVTGTIRVTSRLGRFHDDDQPRFGLLTGLADRIGRWPRGAAA